MKTAQYIFNLSLKPEQIYDFRGALIHLAGAENDIFHNREYANGKWGKPIERYPKIQYRSINGYAAIWAMEEGIEALQKIMKKDGIPHFEMHGVDKPLLKTDKDTQTFIPEVDNTWHYYTLQHFIPFNAATYAIYKKQENYTDKIHYLEKKITDEILLFSYAVNDWNIAPEQRVKTEIVDVLNISTALMQTKDNLGRRVKIHPLSFRLAIRINASLPHGISLGRHKAYGYGILNTL